MIIAELVVIQGNFKEYKLHICKIIIITKCVERNHEIIAAKIVLVLI